VPGRHGEMTKKFLTFSNLGHIVCDNSADGGGKLFRASRPRDFYSPTSLKNCRLFCANVEVGVHRSVSSRRFDSQESLFRQWGSQRFCRNVQQLVPKTPSESGWAHPILLANGARVDSAFRITVSLKTTGGHGLGPQSVIGGAIKASL
jgi:hypothetical protein